MDVVLGLLDEQVFDSLWAKILPLRIPLDSALGPQTSASARFLAKSALAAPTGAGIVARDYAGVSDWPQEGWTTVSAWPRDDIRRQFLSLLVLVYVGSMLLYFCVSGLSYFVLFDKRLMQHPRFLKNQIGMEIMCSLNAIPWLTILMVPWFLAEVRGHSHLYTKVEDGPLGGGWPGWLYMAFSAIFFLVFTDWAIYWIHRLEHHPSVYRHLHKRHHKWVIPTPWSAYAFHPIDGYLQSMPYHIASHFLLPLNKYLYLVLFLFVNLWTIAIHDSDMITGHPLERFINGPAHHTLHHMWFTCNYGQYFTWSDRLGGSYRQPRPDLDPLHAVLEATKEDRSSKLTSAAADSRAIAERIARPQERKEKVA